VRRVVLVIKGTDSLAQVMSSSAQAALGEGEVIVRDGVVLRTPDQVRMYDLIEECKNEFTGLLDAVQFGAEMEATGVERKVPRNLKALEISKRRKAKQHTKKRWDEHSPHRPICLVEVIDGAEGMNIATFNYLYQIYHHLKRYDKSATSKRLRAAAATREDLPCRRGSSVAPREDSPCG
jgi:hypothetical protein